MINKLIAHLAMAGTDTVEDLTAQLLSGALTSEEFNARVSALMSVSKSTDVRWSASDKGCICFYGLSFKRNTYPISIYPDELEILVDVVKDNTEFKEWMAANLANGTLKNTEDTRRRRKDKN